MKEEEYFDGVRSLALMAKKDIGQNFLISAPIAKKIVDSLDIASGEKVLEIGCGAGSLTYFLSSSSGDIEAIDIDEGMIAKVSSDFEKQDKLLVHNGNAMRFDYAPYDKIVGNLPYYITSGIIERVLLGAKKAKKAVFMVQEEMADRILCGVSSKDYGPLNVLMAIRGRAKKIFGVSKSSFAPIPHVDSTVFCIDFYENTEDLKAFYKFVEKMFLNRRKTIFNNLKNFLKDGDLAKNILDMQGISPQKRPEEISPEQYLCLSKNELIKGWIGNYER